MKNECFLAFREPPKSRKYSLIFF